MKCRMCPNKATTLINSGYFKNLYLCDRHGKQFPPWTLQKIQKKEPAK